VPRLMAWMYQYTFEGQAGRTARQSLHPVSHRDTSEGLNINLYQQGSTRRWKDALPEHTRPWDSSHSFAISIRCNISAPVASLIAMLSKYVSCFATMFTSKVPYKFI
jgi:hypothetical protein